MKRLIILYLIFAGYSFSYSLNFRLEPAELEIIKTTDFLYMYDYAEVINLTDSVLHIGWNRKYLTELPFKWATSVECPSGFHDDSHFSNSSFLLEVYPTLNNKFICHAYPNGNIGYLEVEFELFELRNPTEKIPLLFKFTVYESISSASRNFINDYVKISDDMINFSDNVKDIYISDLNGNFLNTSNLSKTISIKSISAGAYLFRIILDNGKILNHKFIKF